MNEDLCNLYINAMGLDTYDLVNGLPNGTVFSELWPPLEMDKMFPPIGVPADIIQKKRTGHIRKFRKDYEIKVCQWTGMEPEELYLKKKGGEEKR